MLRLVKSAAVGSNLRSLAEEFLAIAGAGYLNQ